MPGMPLSEIIYAVEGAELLICRVITAGLAGRPVSGTGTAEFRFSVFRILTCPPLLQGKILLL